MSQKKTVVATLLIQMHRDQDEIEAWTPRTESQSHPGDMSNLMIMYCYKDADVLANVEALQGLGGVKNVVVVYGETTWADYAKEHGLELKRHVCPHNGCEGYEGSAVMGEVLYYTGPL